MVRSAFTDECALLRDWSGSRAPVCLDFGKSNKPEEDAIWCVLPGSTDRRAYIVALTRAGIIGLHRAEKTQAVPDFAEIQKQLEETISANISRLRVQTLNQPAVPLPGFRNYLDGRARRRRRF